MLNHLQPIANEFDSYMQDRAQRLGYKVRFMGPEDTWPAASSGRFALVAFTDMLQEQRGDNFTALSGMQAHHDRCHFVAWSGELGALVQVNVYRNEICGGGDGQGRVGVRTFAEQFFGDAQHRSLPLDEFTAYLDWLAATPQGASASMVALAIRAPETRELVLVRLPSAIAAAGWLRRNT